MFEELALARVFNSSLITLLPSSKGWILFERVSSFSLIPLFVIQPEKGVPRTLSTTLILFLRKVLLPNFVLKILKITKNLIKDKEDNE